MMMMITSTWMSLAICSRVICNFTRETHKAEALAQNLYSYYITWGVYDQIISDPDSDIMSWTVAIHNVWLNVEYLYCWQADMRKSVNKQIGLRRLRIIAHAERNDQIKQNDAAHPFTMLSNYKLTHLIMQK